MNSLVNIYNKKQNENNNYRTISNYPKCAIVICTKFIRTGNHQSLEREMAVVGGNEVTNPFMVTEVYIKLNGSWKLGSLSFTKLMTPGGQ